MNFPGFTRCAQVTHSHHYACSKWSKIIKTRAISPQNTLFDTGTAWCVIDRWTYLRSFNLLRWLIIHVLLTTISLANSKKIQQLQLWFSWFFSQNKMWLTSVACIPVFYTLPNEWFWIDNFFQLISVFEAFQQIGSNYSTFHHCEELLREKKLKIITNVLREPLVFFFQLFKETFSPQRNSML